LESNPLRFIETLISFIRGFVYCLYMPGLKYVNNNGAILVRGRNAVLCYGKCWPKLLSTKRTFDLFFLISM